MDVSASRFCPLCRSELRVADAMHTHLIADHKRSAAEADERRIGLLMAGITEAQAG